MDIRISRIQALCLALLADLGAWLSQETGPVTADDYGLGQAVRGLADPQARLACYVDAQILDTWKGTLREWFESGYEWRADFRLLTKIRISGLRAGQSPTAQVEFENRSGSGAEATPSGSRIWRLVLTAAQDLERIDDVRLVPAAKSA